MSFPANLVTEDFFLTLVSNHTFTNNLGKGMVITSISSPGGGHHGSKFTVSHTKGANNPSFTFTGPSNNFPFRLPNNYRLHCSTGGGFVIAGYYVYDEARISESEHNKVLHDFIAGVKAATVEALREASLETLVDTVASKLTGDEPPATFANRLAELIEEEVEKAVEKFKTDTPED